LLGTGCSGASCITDADDNTFTYTISQELDELYDIAGNNLVVWQDDPSFGINGYSKFKIYSFIITVSDSNHEGTGNGIETC